MGSEMCIRDRSEKDLERVAPAVIEKKLEALLREAFNV